MATSRRSEMSKCASLAQRLLEDDVFRQRRHVTELQISKDCRWRKSGAVDFRKVVALPIYIELVLIISAFVVRVAVNGAVNDWCGLDSGHTTITDSTGCPHSVYISVTRDGSVWLRAGRDHASGSRIQESQDHRINGITGRDHASTDWIYNEEYKSSYQTVILDNDVIHVLQSINYTDYCVLSDLDLRVTVDSGWHPSHLDVFDPQTKHSRIILFRHNRDCNMSTNLTLSADKQGLVCNGGRRNACGRRHLPEVDKSSPTSFIKTVNFDPKGTDHWYCGVDQSTANNINRFTFIGSYYNVYVKLATCDPPKESRVWGHEAKLRPHYDTSPDLVIIPDPTQTALVDGVIRSWQVFSYIVNVEHRVYFQVWRPTRRRSANSSARHNVFYYHGDSEQFSTEYTLVGQTYFPSNELRFQEISLDSHETIAVRKGDLLGLHFFRYNPVTWSEVPCAHAGHRYMKAELSTHPAASTDPTAAPHRHRHMHPGTTLRFTTATSGGNDEQRPCRQYSFTALLADKTGSKAVEDWLCPSSPLTLSTGRLDTGSDVRSHVIDNRKLPLDAAMSDDATSLTRTFSSNRQLREGAPHVDDVIIIPYILVTFGCLLAIFVVIGLVSYCAAIKS